MKAVVHPTGEQLAPLRQLYHEGAYLRAYERARAIGPLEAWRGTDARVFAGRIALSLGGRRLGEALFLRAWREDRGHVEAAYFASYVLQRVRGPYAAWRHVRDLDVPDAIQPAHLAADLLARGAGLLGTLRDFDRAEDLMRQAFARAPTRPWLHVEQSALLLMADDFEPALRAAREALRLRPWYRPAVQAAASALVALGRDDEALALLREAGAQIESPDVAARLAAMELELGLLAEAEQSFARYEQLAVLADRQAREWVADRRALIACMGGRPLDGLALLEPAARTKYHRTLVAALKQAAGGARRRVLPVGYVRQHHLTCAPATLSTLSRYWNRPADHLAVTEAICYDGTPAHSERKWAEDHGWLVREFRVTWDAVRALTDRGVPFTFTLVEPGNAHLQAVIGYDTGRGTVILRDPYYRMMIEYFHEDMARDHAANGPRGMIMLPPAEAGRLEGLELPDAALYNLYYEVQCALLAHARERAAEAGAALAARAPRHPLSINARFSIASYDNDRRRCLACLDELHALHPDDANIQHARLWHLREFSRTSDVLRLLEAECASRKAPDLFREQLSGMLRSDARNHARVERLLRPQLRGTAAGAHWEYAGLRWDQNRREEAYELYRFAACLQDKNERFVDSFFIAAGHFKQREAALRFLRRRFERYGRKSGGPAQTLVLALERMQRGGEAVAVLDEALAMRPEDGPLLIFAADFYGRVGRFDRTEALLAAAAGRARNLDLQRQAALLADYHGDLPGALARWREVAALDPLSADAHRAVADKLAELEGPEQAVAYLRGIVDRFPHNLALLRTLVERLREQPAAAEAALRRLLEAAPDDAWGRRELADVLCRAKRFREAHEQLDAAGRIEPDHPSNLNILGVVLREEGDVAAARNTFKRAITLQTDDDFAINQLLALSPTARESREAVEHVRSELRRQTMWGDGLMAYHRHARTVLPPQEMLEHLQEAHAARPDLWQTWVALCSQQIDMEQLDAAEATARQLTERFPLLPRAWTELAQVHNARRDWPREAGALETALAITPTWAWAIRLLADSYARQGREADALALLERAVAQAPLDAFHRGYLADALWKCARRDEALTEISRAVQIDPSYRWAWDQIAAWGAETGRPGLLVDMAEKLTREKPGDPRSWVVLARACEAPGQFDRRLAALDRALELDPLDADTHDAKATVLAEEHRFSEALAACQPAAWAGRTPVNLLGRAIWIRAQQTGELAAASDDMRDLLRTYPDYVWGWNQVASWLRQQKDPAGYLAAADQLVRLAPRDVFSFGLRADARAMNGDARGALADLGRAFEMDATYTFAGFRLFDQHLRDEHYVVARQVLARLRSGNENPLVELRAYRLAAAERDAPAALAALRRVCQHNGLEADVWRDLAADVTRCAWAQAALDLLEAEALRPCPDPYVPMAFVHACYASGAAGRARKLLDALWSKEAEGRRRVLFAIEELSGIHREAVGRYVLTRRRRLRATPEGWMAGLYFLLSGNRLWDALLWIRGWRQREGLTAAALHNVAIVSRAFGRTTAALAANRRALDQPDTPLEFRARHSLWPLTHRAGAKEAPAPGLFDGFPAAGLTGDGDRFILGLATAAVAAREPTRDRGARTRAFLDARAGLLARYDRACAAAECRLAGRLLAGRLALELRSPRLALVWLQNCNKALVLALGAAACIVLSALRALCQVLAAR